MFVSTKPMMSAHNESASAAIEYVLALLYLVPNPFTFCSRMRQEWSDLSFGQSPHGIDRLESC